MDIMLLSLTFALPTSCLADGEPSLASDHKLVYTGDLVVI